MNKYMVKSAEDALVYITDCTLATVSSLAGKRSRSNYEFERQKSIAQTAIDWMVEMRIDFASTRTAEVQIAGSVEKWASQYDVKARNPSAQLEAK